MRTAWSGNITLEHSLTSSLYHFDIVGVAFIAKHCPGSWRGGRGDWEDMTFNWKIQEIYTRSGYSQQKLKLYSVEHAIKKESGARQGLSFKHQWMHVHVHWGPLHLTINL